MRPNLLIASLLVAPLLAAQDSTSTEEWTAEEETSESYVDSLIDTFEFQYGTIDLANGVGTLQLPESFKFLGGEQAHQLIVDVWENPPSITDNMQGVVMYADAGPYDVRTAFIVYWDPMGHVSDTDADAINYDQMMQRMLTEDSTDNAQRIAAGYTPLELVGWASAPYYDRVRKVLHWAKEMRQEGSEDNILNYNIRVLGRRGVIILNGLSTMSRLEQVKAEVPIMLEMTSFNDGHRYDQFNPETDTEAAQTLGGLISGEVKEKVVGMVKTAIKVIIGVVVGMIVLVVLIWIFVVQRKRKRAAGV